MVDVTATDRRGFRVPRLVEIVLALSLALNVCIAGGFFFSRWTVQNHPAPPTGVDRALDQIIVRLGINLEQSKAYANLHHSLKLARDQFAASHRPLSEQIWIELGKPEPDPDQLQHLVDVGAEDRRVFQGQMVKAMAEFLATLTPEQREAFAKVARDRQDPTGVPLRANIGN